VAVDGDEPTEMRGLGASVRECNHDSRIVDWDLNSRSKALSGGSLA
jgi:hypothetical protein